MEGNDSLDPVPEQEMKTIQGGAVVVDESPPDKVNISIPDEEAIFRGPASDTETSADVAIIVDIES